MVNQAVHCKSLEFIPEGYVPDEGDVIRIYYEPYHYYRGSLNSASDELEVTGPIENIHSVTEGLICWEISAIPVKKLEEEEQFWLPSAILNFRPDRPIRFQPQYRLCTVDTENGNTVTGIMGYQNMRGIEVTPAEERTPNSENLEI